MVVPAPWELAGHGFVVILAPRLDQRSAFLPGSQPRYFGSIGSLGVLMAINYLRSTAGPYQEVLYIPGYASIHLGAGCSGCHPKHPRVIRGHSIAQIYVSTSPSRDGGIANWGIPKEVANIAWDGSHNGANLIRLSTRRGSPLLTLHVGASGWNPAIPVGLRFLPHTLVQVADSLAFVTSIGGSARVMPTGPIRLTSHSSETAEVASRRVLATFRISQFRLHFPEATTYPLTRPSKNRKPLSNGS